MEAAKDRRTLSDGPGVKLNRQRRDTENRPTEEEKEKERMEEGDGDEDSVSLPNLTYAMLTLA